MDLIPNYKTEKNMFYHLRYTPYELSTDFSFFQAKFDKIIIAQEGGPDTEKELHYHMWLESDLSDDGVRDHFRKWMKIPKMGRGKTNKYYCLKSWDANFEYIIKDGNLVLDRRQGYPLTSNKLQEKEILAVEAPPSTKEKKERKDEWGQLLDHFINKEIIGLNGYRKEICKYYLMKLRPIPRFGDLDRYARSIMILKKSKYGENEGTLNLEISQFIEDQFP